MNKIILIGNLTRDPESGTTSSGVSYCNFSIAVSRRFSKENETDYFNVKTWRGTAENSAKFLNKGKKVCVVGSMQMRTYEANDGSKKTVYEVMADEVEFLSSAGEKSAENIKTNTDVTQLEEAQTEDGNLPF